MEMVNVLILAVIQGFTEFLPISSSGHLALAEHFLDFNPPGVALEVVLHAGTLLTILIYYRKRLTEMLIAVLHCDKDTIGYALLIALASLPVIVLYALAGDEIEAFSDNAVLVSIFLIVTGFIMLSSYFAPKNGERKVGVLSSILIGIAQAFALLPGISRSGSTIVSARHLGVPAAKAAEFSFFMAIPALGGAVILKLPEILHADLGCTPVELGAGLITSCLVGLAAIGLLMRLISRGKFWYFGIYCLVIGAVALVLVM